MINGNIFNVKKESPKKLVYPYKNHDSKGGLEKYPISSDFDQSQYCASSPYKENSVK